MKNSQRYIPDPNYYRITKDREIVPLLRKAVGLINKTQPTTALDFGCGGGSETRFLLNNGFHVTAVDGNQDSKAYIEQLPFNERVQFVHSDFENFSFDTYDLINSSRSLSFIHVNEFNAVLHKLLHSLRPGGIFVGDFYGPNDEWNKPEETMTFLNHSRIVTLFNELEILVLTEAENDGKLANGKPKHVHTFSFLVRKPKD